MRKIRLLFQVLLLIALYEASCRLLIHYLLWPWMQQMPPEFFEFWADPMSSLTVFGTIIRLVMAVLLVVGFTYFTGRLGTLKQLFSPPSGRLAPFASGTVYGALLLSGMVWLCSLLELFPFPGFDFSPSNLFAKGVEGLFAALTFELMRATIILVLKENYSYSWSLLIPALVVGGFSLMESIEFGCGAFAFAFALGSLFSWSGNLFVVTGFHWGWRLVEGVVFDLDPVAEWYALIPLILMGLFFLVKRRGDV